MNQDILDWQNSFGLFSVPYSGPKDGEINPQFVNSIMTVESKYKAYGEIFSGSGIIMKVSAAKKKFLNIEDSVKPILEDKNLIPAESPIDSTWELFFNQNLPVVGNLYNGDLVSTAKKLESTIGKLIDKPMNGIIWNDSKKQFNTTTDDIKNALNLIENHNKISKKQAKFTTDERIIKMLQIIHNK